MRAALVALLLMLVLAGCAMKTRVSMDHEPSGIPAQTRGDDEFWMVWVHGDETRPCSGVVCSRVSCSIVFDHSVDPAARAFRHANESAPEAPRTLLAFDVFDEGGCPVAYKHGFDLAKAHEPMGATSVDIVIHEDGSLVVNGENTPIGQRSRFTYDTGEERGEFVVENLGAWTVGGIERDAR
jgi:hypothetical protein